MEKLTEEQFDAIRAWPTYNAYEEDNRPIVRQTTTSQVNVSDVELLAEIRDQLDPDTSLAFDDEQVFAKLDYTRGQNNFRETVSATVTMLEESKARQDASKAEAGPPEP